MNLSAQCPRNDPHHPHLWTPEPGIGGGTALTYACKGVAASKPAIRESALPGGGAWDRPEHYGGEENPFEPIKIIEHYGLNFNLGSVVKYVLRAGRKPDDSKGFDGGNVFDLGALKDLRKAYTYIGFEIRKREQERDKKTAR